MKVIYALSFIVLFLMTDQGNCSKCVNKTYCIQKVADFDKHHSCEMTCHAKNCSDSHVESGSCEVDMGNGTYKKGFHCKCS